MKKVLLVFGILALCCGALQADACVGKALSIGVLNTSEGQVFAELLSALITERTGTTIAVHYYRNMPEIYDAVRQKKVEILIDNTSKAMLLLDKPAEPDAKKAYEYVKTVYEKEKGMVWMKPFGFLNSNGQSSPSYTAAVLRVDVISNFPVLPRVINKIGSTIDDEAYNRLIKAVEAGEKPKKAARDFLKSKKLI